MRKKRGEKEKRNIIFLSDLCLSLFLALFFLSSVSHSLGSLRPLVNQNRTKTSSPAVKLTSITVRAVDAETCPRKVRVFVNRPSIGFSEAEADPATAEFELDRDAAVASTSSGPSSSSEGGSNSGAREALKVAKFTNVTSVAVFFADNHGGAETTRVASISLEGSAGETFNVSEIKKVGEEGGAGGA